MVSHLPDDLFEEAPSMEQALCAAPSARGITVADLEVVRECAGSPGPLKRFVPETSSPSDIMMNTPPHLRGGGDDEWIKTIDRRLSVVHAFAAIGAQASELWRRSTRKQLRRRTRQERVAAVCVFTSRGGVFVRHERGERSGRERRVRRATSAR